MCAALFNMSNPKPAVSGLMVDPAAIAQNFGGTVQTIFDMGVQDILQSGMLKQLQTQGFSVASLRNLLTGPLGRFGFNKLLNVFNNKKEAKNTKKKEIELLEQEQALYVEAAKANAAAKLEIAEKQADETASLLSKKRNELYQKESNLRNAESTREQARSIGGQEEINAIDALDTARSEYLKVQADIEELSAQLQGQKRTEKLVRDEQSVIGTDKDPLYQSKNKRKEALKKEQDNNNIVVAENADNKIDWANIKMEELSKYVMTDEDYKEFIKQYFYEPSADAYMKLLQGKELENAQIKHDGMEKSVERNRKMLVRDTMVHLLQVSATIRREKPVREALAKKWFDEAKETQDEITATTAYSNTRIENSRALLLYAKLLAAKMQYNAAKEIEQFGLEKLGKIEDNNYSYIDLSKYLLTNEELIEAIINSSMTQVIQGVLDAGLTE